MSTIRENIQWLRVTSPKTAAKELSELSNENARLCKDLEKAESILRAIRLTVSIAGSHSRHETMARHVKGCPTLWDAIEDAQRYCIKKEKQTKMRLSRPTISYPINAGQREVTSEPENAT